MSVYITGDTHGKFGRFLDMRFSERAYTDQYDFVIVAGDCGILWDGTPEEECLLDMLEQMPFTLLFVDGNHENFDLLKRYPVESWHNGEVQRIRPHILHLMRGNCYTLENHTFFVMGGAQSPDIADGIFEPDDPERLNKIAALEAEGRYYYRTRGLDWFPEEMPSDAELKLGLENLKVHNMNVDYIITHAAPSALVQYFSAGRFAADKLTGYFEQLRKQVNFRTWYCGHYHADEDITLEGKEYRILYHRIQKIC